MPLEHGSDIILLLTCSKDKEVPESVRLKSSTVFLAIKFLYLDYFKKCLVGLSFYIILDLSQRPRNNSYISCYYLKTYSLVYFLPLLANDSLKIKSKKSTFAH